MSIQRCLTEKCKWLGTPDEIFDHFEVDHRAFIVEINDVLKDEFRLNICELKPATYLIVANESLYWFLIREASGGSELDLHFGLFLVEDSSPISYHMIFGEDGCESLMVYGNFECAEEWDPVDSDLPIQLTASFAEYFNVFNLKVARLSLKIHIPEEVGLQMAIAPENVNWNDPENRENNQELIEKYTCPVCMEYMRDNFTLCENKHVLCSTCFNKMSETFPTVKCPLCMGKIYDKMASQDMETEAQMVLFPDTELFQRLNLTDPREQQPSAH